LAIAKLMESEVLAIFLEKARASGHKELMLPWTAECKSIVTPEEELDCAAKGLVSEDCEAPAVA
jgi:hypothetical protein